MNTTSKISNEKAVEDLQQTDHMVTKSVAGQMTGKYRRFRNLLLKAQKLFPVSIPLFPLCVSYNKTAISQLLAQPGCVGLRIFPGINASGAISFILAGIDGGNQTLTGDGGLSAKTSGSLMVDEGQTSPP